MAGTILKQLSTTAQADGTDMTSGPGNTGFSSHSLGAGNTADHLAAAAMGEPVGYRLTQGGANQNNWFLDLAAAVTKFAWRFPFRHAATPTANVAVFRTFSDVAHAVNLGGLSITTTNRVQYLENGTGGLNVSSPSGAQALVPGDPYVCLGLLDTDTNTATIHVYDLGVVSPRFTLSGALAADAAAAAGFRSIRVGISTASALTQLDINSAFAIGSGDFLARTDVTLTATLTASTLAAEAGQAVTVDASVAAGATGRVWRVAAITNGATAPTLEAGASADQKIFRAPVTRGGCTVTIGYLPTGAPATESFLSIDILPVTTVAGAARAAATGVIVQPT